MRQVSRRRTCEARLAELRPLFRDPAADRPKVESRREKRGAYEGSEPGVGNGCLGVLHFVRKQRQRAFAVSLRRL